MRPRRLAFQAFGPFAAPQVLDFAALGPHRLFLVHGRTGAGKSTVLDALCYALFGESAGEEREARHLRSHHAAEDLRTEVTLDFAVGARAFRVRRRPPWTRARRRGAGEREEPAEVALWRLPPGGGAECVSEKEREVADALRTVLGYTAAEFRQVVVLPQGRFRELLTATPRDREAILARLFRPDLYADLQRRLVEDAAAARAALAGIDGERNRALKGMEAADAGAAAAMAAARVEHAREARAMARTAARDDRVATAALQGGERAAGLLEADARARSALAAAEREAVAAAPGRARLAAARRAAALVPRAEAAEREAVGAAAAATERGEALARAAEADRALGVAAAALVDEPTRVAAAGTARDRAARAAARIAPARDLVAAEKTLADETARTVRCEDLRDAAVRARAEAAAARDRAVVDRDTMAAVAAPLARLELEVESARGRSEARAAAARTAEAARCAARAARAAADVSETRETLAAEAGRALQAGERAWSRHRTARMALDLVEGEPCSVCGATDHPRPARPDAAADLPDLGVLGAELEAARAEAAAAVGRRGEADRRAATAQARAEAAAAQPGAADDPERSAAAVREALAAAALAREARDALPDAEALVLRAEAASAEGEATMDVARKAHEAAALALATARARRDALAAHLPPDARDPAVMEREADEAARAAEEAEAALARDRDALRRAEAEEGQATRALAEAVSRATALAGQADKATAALGGACAAAGFADAAALSAALLPAAIAEALEADLARCDGGLDRARGAAGAAARAAAGLAAPDLVGLRARAVAAGAVAATAADGAVRAQVAAEAAAEALAGIEVLDGRRAAAEAAWQVRDGLARLARGDNDLRLDLKGYVLATRLDETLAAANRRLAGLLGGRFRLLRQALPERGNRSVGLGLDVHDGWTGRTRPAGTLSGGEGFCASLALALGLADTVQAHAGGCRIEALFVDEGFGTLDEETLDTAVEVLCGLGDADRLVGVVSHVAELRRRIPARLEVVRGEAGSGARFRLD